MRGTLWSGLNDEPLVEYEQGKELDRTTWRPARGLREPLGSSLSRSFGHIGLSRRSDRIHRISDFRSASG
jgi:hypothetical protein